ncbi:hypothetical protein NE237_000302 [Protea cynaroides]|uniref:Uncharacterized protein n=1 Tax=Protea cynaroides TaxID=273540 RepID=A0A9Q0KRS2_9MAGN|nr:hypothetical protein NE237_000302 [Protea cynaroides]
MEEQDQMEKQSVPLIAGIESQAKKAGFLHGKRVHYDHKPSEEGEGMMGFEEGEMKHQKEVKDLEIKQGPAIELVQTPNQLLRTGPAIFVCPSNRMASSMCLTLQSGQLHPAVGTLSKFGSGLFLLVQVIILLDCTHSWNDAWVEKDEQVTGILLLAYVISLYCAYVCYTGLSSEPRDYVCNGLRKKSKAVSTGTFVLGMLTTILSI